MAGNGKIAGIALMVPCAIIGFVMLIVFVSSFRTVGPGEVGVLKSFGAVKRPSKKEGLHWLWPMGMQTMTIVDTKIAIVKNTEVASSKDLQTVTSAVSITYYISGASAPDVVQKLGNRDDVEEAIIIPAMSESVKAVTAMYTAEELVTKRPEAKRSIQEKVRIFMDETLKSKDLPSHTIRMSNIAITDFEFSREFNRAIESKVKAEQEAKQAENEKVRRITQAEAAAQEQHLQAEAEAFKITQLAKARANAIRQESLALKNNPELIQLRLAEKWNGVLPRFTGGGSGTSMLLNIDGIMNDSKRSSRALEFIMDGEDDNDVPEHHPRAQALKHAQVGA